MRKQLIAGLCMAGMLVTLAGCAKGTYDDPRTGYEQVYRLDDGRRVTCIRDTGGTNGLGLSCDWAHADGADKGWSQ